MIKSIQSDWGGEYCILSSILAKFGISHTVSCPHTHEQQGKVERKHRHIVETGLSLLAHISTPACYRHFALETAVYLINHLPSPTNNGRSPFELAFHKSPDYSILKVFGSLCFPHIRPYNKHKFSFRSMPCVFLGYSSKHLGYRCHDRATGRMYIARDVQFDEVTFPFNATSILGPHPSTLRPNSPWLLVEFPPYLQFLLHP